MKHRRVAPAALAVGAVMVLGACGSSSTSTASSTASTSSTTTTSEATSSTTTPSAASSTTIGVATNSKVGQQIVVDASGKTVYMYLPNGTSATSKVPSAIKANWPAVTATGTPTAGAGLDQSKLALEVQPDGTRQVAYGGHLLYTFVRDTAPGDANGQGLGGIWFTVSPAGNMIG